MKFYNPFKPHIVRLKSTQFAVREFSLLYLEWRYSDKDGDLYALPRHPYYDIVYARETLARRIAKKAADKLPFATFYSKD